MKRSGIRVSRSTVENMAPIDDAPKTQERVRSGEIKTATQATREALKETGAVEPPKFSSTTAWKRLQNGRSSIKGAYELLAAGEKGDKQPAEFVSMITEIRDYLDLIEQEVTKS